jgi:hypothetical protein
MKERYKCKLEQRILLIYIMDTYVLPDFSIWKEMLVLLFSLLCRSNWLSFWNKASQYQKKLEEGEEEESK